MTPKQKPNTSKPVLDHHNFNFDQKAPVMGVEGRLPQTLKGRLMLVGSVALFSLVSFGLYMKAYPAPSIIREEDIGVPINGTGESVKRPKVLLVSAFFPVPNPQFTDEQYNIWLPNFLGNNKNDMYIFTTPQLAYRVHSMRNPESTGQFVVDTSYSSPLAIPPMIGVVPKYNAILRKDPVKSRRSIELYASRHSKPFFLHTAIRKMKELSVEYEYAFWSDAGSFRSKHVYAEWPNVERVQEIWEETRNVTGTPVDEVMFFPLSRHPHKSMVFWTEMMGPIDNDISIASFFGGKYKAIDWFTRTYYAYHAWYLDLELFIGKNQAFINALMFLFPDKFVGVWYNDPDAPAHKAVAPPAPSHQKSPHRQTSSDNIFGPPKKDEPSFLGQCGPSTRFYYQFFFGSSTARRGMQKLWIDKASTWRWWGWWRPRDHRPCQTTRVVSFNDFLKRTLDGEYKLPGRRLSIPQEVWW